MNEVDLGVHTDYIPDDVIEDHATKDISFNRLRFLLAALQRSNMDEERWLDDDRVAMRDSPEHRSILDVNRDAFTERLPTDITTDELEAVVGVHHEIAGGFRARCDGTPMVYVSRWGLPDTKDQQECGHPDFEGGQIYPETIPGSPHVWHTEPLECVECGHTEVLFRQGEVEEHLDRYHCRKGVVLYNEAMLRMRPDLVDHDMFAHSWGDDGPGAHQLAVSILAHRYNDEYACENVDVLVEELISEQPRDEPLEIFGVDIRAALDEGVSRNE